jgi:urea transporter
METVLIRFLIGGVVVSLFAALGDVLRPKSFAGLFGAAPSIALATIGLTMHQDGKAYAALECRSMMLGAVAFFIYALLVSWVLRRYKPSALLSSLNLMPAWFAVSLGLWRLVERRL